MTQPLVSVVIETINARADGAAGPLADELAGTLEALNRQTYPRGLIERIVVIDGEVAAADVDDLRRRYPAVKIVSSPVSNYFAAKNAGAAASAGDVVAFVDSDCLPAADWLEALTRRLGPGVAGVGGRSRYPGRSWGVRTFTVPALAYALAEEDGTATGFNLSNVAFRREVLLAHPLETRLRRNGGCYLLYHQLRAEGARVLFENRAVVEHAPDPRGLFARKHFERGYDGVAAYRLDDRGVLRGTRLFRRLGPAALVPITGRRIALDWLLLLRHHRQIGVPVVALPYFGAVAVVTRLVELAGGLAAVVAHRSSSPES